MGAMTLTGARLPALILFLTKVEVEVTVEVEGTALILASPTGQESTLLRCGNQEQELCLGWRGGGPNQSPCPEPWCTGGCVLLAR